MSDDIYFKLGERINQFEGRIAISMVRVSDKKPEMGDKKIGLGAAESFGSI